MAQDVVVHVCWVFCHLSLSEAAGSSHRKQSRAQLRSYGRAGESTPPKYGDYEAQRHWMEITLNTPIREWYIDTPSNQLEYWGIDYPPLSAYQSYLSGLVLHALEPAAIQLGSSRGYESPTSKQAMRLTVILSDLIGAPMETLADFCAMGISRSRKIRFLGRLYPDSGRITGVLRAIFESSVQHWCCSCPECNSSACFS